MQGSSAHRLRCTYDVSAVPDGRQQAVALDGRGLLKPQAGDCCDHPWTQAQALPCWHVACSRRSGLCDGSLVVRRAR